MAEKIYRGERDKSGTARVTVNSRKLRPRLDLANHSPTGLEWGYGGSGPAQCALAILADALGGGKNNDALAVHLHQQFKWEVIAPLDQEKPWEMTEQTVLQIVERLKAEDKDTSWREEAS
jgi:hypothetical protein